MRTHILRTHIFACVLALAPISHGWAQSQDDRYPNLPSAGGAAPMVGGAVDDYVVGMLQERKRGFVYIDAVVWPGPRACSNVIILVARNAEGQWHRTSIQAARTVFGVQSASGGTAALDPGEYVLTHVYCINYGSRVLLIGPFARFHVNAGEVVNVGMLTLVRGRDSTGKGAIVSKSVSGMRAEARAAFRQQNPKTAARMVERHMIALGRVAPSAGAAPPGAGAPPSNPEVSTSVEEAR